MEFEKVLVENFASFCDCSSVLIKCRFALALGYYADNLFQQHHDLFIKTIEFLIKNLALESTERVLALQSADTLKSIISDQDMVNRLELFINKVLPHLSTMVGTMSLPAFFDILSSIITSYSTAIDQNLIPLLDALVARIEKEFRELRAKGEKYDLEISKCCNIIRAICDESSFYPEYLDKIENSLLPLFNYLVDPKNVEFDEDLIQYIAILIRRRESISENMAKLFPFMKQYYDKHGGCFGSLMKTVNYYLYYGKEQFMANKVWLEQIMHLAHSSLYSTESPIELNNTNGAVLCQMILQIPTNPILDSYIPLLLAEMLKRLEAAQTLDLLTKQLYNAFLCAICNNAHVTLTYLETQGKLAPLLDAIAKDVKKYRGNYDKKVLVIGLSNVIAQENLPASISKASSKILDIIVTVLQEQTAEETKKLLKSDKKAISVDASSSEDDSSDSGEEDEMMDSGNKIKGEEKYL